MAWLGKARQGSNGGAWRGVAWRGLARQGSNGGAWHGEAGHGEARQGSNGVARRGMARQGMARQGKAATARRGMAWQGKARQGSNGEARQGSNGGARLGGAGQGLARQGSNGGAWRGAARRGSARQGSNGRAWRGWAGLGEARQARKMTRNKQPNRPRETTGMTDTAHGNSLYRYLNARGQLLYVGITGTGTARMHQHAATAPWWPQAALCLIAHYPSREEARAAELAAIKNEDPPYNVEGTGHKQRQPFEGDPFDGLGS